MDITDYSYWLKAKQGDFVQLTDEQAIEESRQKGLGLIGISYEIKRVHEVTEFNQICKWIFVELEDPDDTLFLVVRKFDDEFEMRLYYVEPGVEPGSRHDLLSDGFDFLFADGENADMNNLDELELAREIFVNIENEDGEIHETCFRQKRQGMLLGEFSYKDASHKKLQACISEYSAIHDVEIPEMMIYEFWPKDSESCETMMFLRGSDLSVSEVDLLLN